MRQRGLQGDLQLIREQPQLRLPLCTHRLDSEVSDEPGREKDPAHQSIAKEKGPADQSIAKLPEYCGYRDDRELEMDRCRTNGFATRKLTRFQYIRKKPSEYRFAHQHIVKRLPATARQMAPPSSTAHAPAAKLETASASPSKDVGTICSECRGMQSPPRSFRTRTKCCYNTIITNFRQGQHPIDGRC